MLTKIRIYVPGFFTNSMLKKNKKIFLGAKVYIPINEFFLV